MGEMADYYAEEALFNELEYNGQFTDDRPYRNWRQTMQSKTQRKQRINDKITRNKFYVGSPRALDNNWGHPTLAKAVRHAEEVMEEQSLEETFVVQIIRVVRRRKAPVEVEKV